MLKRNKLSIIVSDDTDVRELAAKMAAILETRRLTADEFLALPADGTDRWLIHGELREAEMTIRNWQHSSIMARLALALGKWWELQPAPRGTILCGEGGVKLTSQDIVGVDVAYISAEVTARQTGSTTLIEGVPTLVVEILSPHDKLSAIEEKTELYLRAGVSLVWTINSVRRTATIYRPNQPDRLATVNDSLSGEEALPGLVIPMAKLFEA